MNETTINKINPVENPFSGTISNTDNYIKGHISAINKIARILFYKNYEEMYDILTPLGILVSNKNCETETEFPYYTEVTITFTHTCNESIKNKYSSFTRRDLACLFEHYDVNYNYKGEVESLTFCN